MNYQCIAADPPWTFANNVLTAAADAEYVQSKKRCILKHYKTMLVDDIKALPVAELAAKDCALFLWALDTHLPEALDVIRAWGFKFKTIGFNWVKTTKDGRAPIMRCGWWTRAGSELCLLATKGKPKPLVRNVYRVVLSPVREHSRKPDVIYDDIQRLVAGPYVELFARIRRPGWDVAFSNEPDKFQYP